jgi:Bacteriophage minor capsid protein
MLYTDIVALLEANTTLEFGDNLYWGTMPASSEPSEDPDPTVALYETPGPGGTFAKDGLGRDEARLQVLVRSESYEAAMSTALEVRGHLDGLFTRNGTRYHARPNQRPFDLGAQDEHGRTIISANYTLKL